MTPKPRRRPGTGSVFQRKDGRWVARHPCFKDEYFHTKKDAVARLAAMNREIKAAVVKPAPKPKPPPLTVAAYLETWIAATLIPTFIASTADTYARGLRTQIIPHLGAHRLADLSPGDVQAAQAALAQSYAPKTVGVTFSALRTALNDAVNARLIPANPALGVRRLPIRTLRTAPDFTPVLAQRILAAAKGTAAERSVALALLAGLRLGEVYGLDWADFTPDLAQLHVRRQMQYVDPSVRRDAVYDVRPPKGGHSRVVPVCGPLRAILAPHRQPDGPVCTSRSGGRVSFKGLEKRHLKPLHDAGIGVRFHDLRIGYATLLYQQGVNPITVQRLLGHKSVDMTAHYTHTQSAELYAAVALLDGLGEPLADAAGETDRTLGEHV